MRGHATATGLWLPGRRKRDGGTWFDDELDSEQRALVEQTGELVRHLNQRQDHTVYVASTGDRDRMRQVFNWFRKEQWIGHNPKIKIDYGIRDGEMRIGP